MKKKLNLSRESIRALQNDGTRQVVAGNIATLGCPPVTGRAIECIPGYTCYPGCVFR